MGDFIQHSSYPSLHTLEPACHSYLGPNLQDIRVRQGVNIDPLKAYELLLIPLHDIVLFPGETIPLRLQQRGVIERVESILNTSAFNELHGIKDNAMQIGIVNMYSQQDSVNVFGVYRRRSNTICTIGTTIEVRSSFNTMDLESNARGAADNMPRRHAEELVLTAKGRHRFKIEQVRRDSPGGEILYATVKILQDHMPSSSKIHTVGFGGYGCFPRWVHRLNSPRFLARKCYDLVEASLAWKVNGFIELRGTPIIAMYLVCTFEMPRCFICAIMSLMLLYPFYALILNSPSRMPSFVNGGHNTAQIPHYQQLVPMQPVEQVRM